MTTTTTHEKTHATVEHAARTWQDEYFRFVKRIEAPVLETTTRMAARFADVVPDRPAFLAPLPKAHVVRDAMDTGFTFRKRVVEEQTMFARRMMKAMEPMLTKLDTVQPPETLEQRTAPVRSDKQPTRSKQHRAA